MRDIRIDRDNDRIVLTRAFAQKADDPKTEEFLILQNAMNTYPTFRVVNHTIKKNPNKECYKGLTYDYMREYIAGHEPRATVENVLNELEDMIGISKCHSKGYRYPTIKKWFLDKYPEVERFGKDEKQVKTKKNIICTDRTELAA